MKVVDHDLLSDTPFISVDLNIMDKNIQQISHLAKTANIKLRPHTKTHKSIYIANKQILNGASGITTAKLGEAEVMANHGIKDILIAFPIFGNSKLYRLNNLLNKAKITVSLDEYIVAKGLNDVGEYRKEIIPIYIDVDTGLGRMGKGPKESIQTILQIDKLPFVEIKGLMSHTGQAYLAQTEEEIKNIAIEDATILYSVKKDLESYEIFVEEISVGASATARFIGEIPYITEARPGMYIFNDRLVMGAGGATVKDCAATVFSTVISRPSKDRLIIDAGSKTLAQDTYKEGGFGYVKGHEELFIKNLSEEHGIVEIRGECSLQVGDVLEIIPNHICPVINLADNLYGFRDGEFERVIRVDGRGKNR